MMVDRKNLRLPTKMLKSSLCNYSDTYIFAKRAITVVGQEANVAAFAEVRDNKQITFKNHAQVTSCIGEINDTKIMLKILTLRC